MKTCAAPGSRHGTGARSARLRRGNLGGAVQFFSADPTDKRGLPGDAVLWKLEQDTRTFARFDSGLLPTHTKLFVDAVYADLRKMEGRR